jgi:uncharacterized membrane protein YfcA
MESYIVILLCVAAFSGFIDAIVGGGGLIQTRRIILLPFACCDRYWYLKIPCFCGTSFAAYQYLKKVTMN